PVQPARGRVRAAPELPARVELREHDLDSRQARLRLDVDGDAATVVGDRDGAVVVQRHEDVLAEAAERLVDRVVDDLPQAVHEPARVGRPDVHPGSLAHRLEALEDGQVPCGVARLGGHCGHAGRLVARGRRTGEPRGKYAGSELLRTRGMDVARRWLDTNVTTTTTAPLTAADRCDRCNAQAYVRVVLSVGELLFCGHH